MRLFRPLLQALREHTGFTGVVPNPNARAALAGVFESTLSKLQRLPADYAYRSATAAITQKRLQLVQSDASVEAIEAELGEGPIEFALKQAEAENQLVDQLAKWKPWEPLEHPAPEGQWDYAFKQKPQ